jgi:hypothetical protein
MALKTEKGTKLTDEQGKMKVNMIPEGEIVA